MVNCLGSFRMVHTRWDLPGFVNNVTPLGPLKARPRGRLTVQKGEKKKLEGRAGKAKKIKSGT